MLNSCYFRAAGGLLVMLLEQDLIQPTGSRSDARGPSLSGNSDGLRGLAMAAKELLWISKDCKSFKIQ